MRPTKPLALAFAGILAAGWTTVGHTATPDGPYWIVVGSFANPDYAQPQYAAIRRAADAVARCGLKPFNDFSGKFEGFREGFDVVVVGGYGDRTAAKRDLARLRPCVPGATVRPGRYLGE